MAMSMTFRWNKLINDMLYDVTLNKLSYTPIIYELDSQYKCLVNASRVIWVQEKYAAVLDKVDKSNISNASHAG